MPIEVTITAYFISCAITIWLVADNMRLRKRNRQLHNQLHTINQYMQHANTNAGTKRAN